MCDNHAQFHCKGLNFRSHTLVPIHLPSSSTSSSSGTPFPTTYHLVNIPIVCSEHQRPCEIWCEEDSTCCCVICTTTSSHRGHHFMTLDETFKQNLSTYMNKMDQARMRVEQFKKQMSEVQLQQHAVDRQEDKLTLGLRN